MPDPIPTYPGQYDPNGTTNSPQGSESRQLGDDELRILKANINRTTPNWTGPVLANQDQMNALSDYDVPGDSIETRLATLEANSAKFPGGGVVMLMFRNAVAAIPGWVQLTDAAYDDAMMRVINTATPGQGGSANPISMSASDVPAHPHSASTPGDDGVHDHPIYVGGGGQQRNGIDVQVVVGEVTPTEQISNATNFLVVNQRGGHGHAITVSPNTGPAAWEPKYFDVIIASKT